MKKGELLVRADIHTSVKHEEYTRRDPKIQWRFDIRTAKELCYPKEVIKRLENEPSQYKRQNILTDARRKMR